MTATEIRDNWRKSSRSGEEGSCVEVSEGMTVGLRDTKDRDGGELWLSRQSFTALLNSAIATI